MSKTPICSSLLANKKRLFMLAQPPEHLHDLFPGGKGAVPLPLALSPGDNTCFLRPGAGLLRPTGRRGISGLLQILRHRRFYRGPEIIHRHPVLGPPVEYVGVVAGNAKLAALGVTDHHPWLRGV